MSQLGSRRHFLAACAAALGASLVPVEFLRAESPAPIGSDPHPTPRPGITGAHVLAREHLADKPQLIPLFDGIREIPEIVDGIRCNCGCAHSEGFYSLLSCYEGSGAMARECPVCQGQGRLAVRMKKEGKSLDEIRAAIDTAFG